MNPHLQSIPTAIRRPDKSFCPLTIRTYVFALLVTLGVLFYPPIVQAQTELIPNDKFADDGASWRLAAGASGAANMSVEKVDNESALCIEVQGGGKSEANSETVAMTRVYRLFGEINADANYRISFKAKSQNSRDIVSFISPEKENARVLWRTSIKIEPEWKEFSFPFVSKDSASDVVFGFTRLGDAANKFWFKDVVLTAE